MAPEEESKTESHAGRWALWIVAALVIYILSIGPMNAVVARRWMFQEEPAQTLKMFYAPLLCLKGCRPAAVMIYRYEGWWDRVWPGTRPPFETWLFHNPDAIEIPAEASIP